jgi:hypothetical protein
MNGIILFLGQLALVLAGMAACVGFMVVIVSGTKFVVKALKQTVKL